MKKTLEIKLMIIENFIDHLGASDEYTGMMKTLALSYVEEDHVDEIAQAFPDLESGSRAIELLEDARGVMLYFTDAPDFDDEHSEVYEAIAAFLDGEGKATPQDKEEEDSTCLAIECPKCDYWENAPDDIPRRKLDVVKNVSADGRFTECKCPLCHHEWTMDWINLL
jgi:ribosomal protein S27E